MNTNKFKNKLLDDWPAKIICFILAILIYFFHQLSVLDRKVFTVPLSVVENGMMTTTGEFNNNKYVKITVRGKAEQLSAINEKDFVAYIDISSQTKEGKYQVPVQIEPSERLTKLEVLEISASPEKINVVLEESIFRFVNVSATLAGQPSYGYEVSGVSVEPSTTRVSGSKTMVQSIQQIQTDKVEISNLTESVTQKVKLLNHNKKINVDTDEEFEVTVSITPVIQTKDLQGIDVVYSNLKDGADIVSSRASLEVELEGPVLSLDRVTTRNVIASADCSVISESGTYTVPVYIIAPSSLKVINQSLTTVQVTAVFKEEEADPFEDFEYEHIIESELDSSLE